MGGELCLNQSDVNILSQVSESAGVGVAAGVGVEKSRLQHLWFI